MNICMCGVEDGYPHDPHCPYPYFGGNVKLEEKWIAAYREKKKSIEQTQPVHALHDKAATEKLIRHFQSS